MEEVFVRVWDWRWMLARHMVNHTERAAGQDHVAITATAVYDYDMTTCIHE